MKQFFRYTLGAIVLSLLILYISPYNFIFIAAKQAIKTGRDTAFLEDYQYFDNNVVKASENPEEWPKHTQYNSIPLSNKINQVHKTYESVAFLVIHQDSLLHESYYQDYSDTSKSNSFSVAKSFVSAMLGKAIEQGHIESLDQKVGDFYPEFSEGLAANLTVGDLSSMATGLDWNEKYDLSINGMMEAYITPDLDKLMLNRKIISPPGEGFVYYSGATQLLGMVIKKATGQSLSSYFSENFWQPMGAVEDALWQVDSKENGMEKAYCCIASNARDFARLSKLYKNHGKWDGKILLDSTFIANSLTPRFEDSPQYGYGWWLKNYKGYNVFMNRGHLGQYVITIPEENLILVRLGHSKGQKGKIPDPFTPDIYRYMDIALELNPDVSAP